METLWINSVTTLLNMSEVADSSGHSKRCSYSQSWMWDRSSTQHPPLGHERGAVRPESASV